MTIRIIKGKKKKRKVIVETPFSSRNLRNLEKTGITIRELAGKNRKKGKKK